jgi:hypothetical protein
MVGRSAGKGCPQAIPLLTGEARLYNKPMNENSRKDIRRLLKTFGIQADEAITAHLNNITGENPLRIRLILQDLSEYSEVPGQAPLHLEVEGEIRR